MKSISLTAMLSVSLLAATLAPADAGVSKAGKSSRVKAVRPNTPICFIQLPNQPMINLQSLCGASGPEKSPSGVSPSGFSGAPPSAFPEEVNTDPALLESNSGMPSMNQSATLPETPITSEDVPNQPDEAVLLNAAPTPAD